MRARSLLLVAAGAALIAPAALHGAAPRDTAYERAERAGHAPGTGTAPDTDPGTGAHAGRDERARTGRHAAARPGPRPGPPHVPRTGGVLDPRHLSRAEDVPVTRYGRPPENVLGAGRGPGAGAVRAADLLGAVRDCVPVSRAPYRSDEGKSADIDVCGRHDAIFWKADLDVDCDGRPGPLCNERTDPLFSDTTAYQQSDGRQLSAERLPYVVVPAPSHRWNHREHGIRRGTVAAVVHRDRVGYAVVGDVGPADIIGEASYALARDLGVRPDPRGGGTPSGVTYILFKGSAASPVESRRAAAAQGERLAREFIGREPALPAGGGPFHPFR